MIMRYWLQEICSATNHTLEIKCLRYAWVSSKIFILLSFIKSPSSSFYRLLPLLMLSIWREKIIFGIESERRTSGKISSGDKKWMKKRLIACRYEWDLFKVFVLRGKHAVRHHGDFFSSGYFSWFWELFVYGCEQKSFSIALYISSSIIKMSQLISIFWPWKGEKNMNKKKKTLYYGSGSLHTIHI